MGRANPCSDVAESVECYLFSVTCRWIWVLLQELHMPLAFGPIHDSWYVGKTKEVCSYKLNERVSIGTVPNSDERCRILLGAYALAVQDTDTEFD
jgi:hypothetical protein